MRVKLGLCVIAVLFLGLVYLMPVAHSNNSGAPEASTGAPKIGGGNEITCQVGCHKDFAVNSGVGKLTIETDGIGNFTQGESIPMRVRISQPNCFKYGFQLVALDPQTLQSVGVFSNLGDRIKLQQKDGRTYLTHLPKATSAAGGEGVFAFTWTAPFGSQTDVVFYATAVAANGNNDFTGDRVYQTQYTLRGNTTQIKENPNNVELVMSPNPASNWVTLQLKAINKKPVEISKIDFVDVSGKVVLHFDWPQEVATNSISSKFELCIERLPVGVYLVNVHTPDYLATTKLLKLN